MTGFINTFVYKFSWSQSIIALALIYALHKSLGHAPFSSLYSSVLFCPCTLNYCQLQSQSHIATDGQSVSQSWYRAPPGAHDQIFIVVWHLRSCFCGAPSVERTGLSFVYAAGPRQRSHSRVRVPWDSRPYFTVSDLRLPFSSPPTTRRFTVEAFDLASTQVTASWVWVWVLCYDRRSAGQSVLE
jgi:hypothetical protein